MTTLQKIKSLTWWNEIAKLKSILTDLLNSSGGGGGSQDLQSVLDNGKYAEVDGGFSYIQLLGGNSDDRNISVSINKPDFSKGSQLNMNNEATLLGNSGSNTTGVLSFNLGKILLRQSVTNDASKRIEVIFEDPIASTYLKLPAKTGGTYILATLDDILKINLDGRIYTNNPTAISGGLSAKDIYRTATGELRIVV
jgi:hypothetical protein